MNTSFKVLIVFLGLMCGVSFAQEPIQSIPNFKEGVSNLRNQRYCEVLIGQRDWLKLDVKVFNTQGLNDCPEVLWSALTKEFIAKTYDASFVLLNGPRYWVMDEIRAAGDSASDIKTSFGGIEMNLRATIQLSLLKQFIASKPYTPSEINRTTNFSYKAGRPVFELTSPTGEIYVMQSYSQIVNTSLSEKDLPVLEGQLNLPAGWTYGKRMLDQDLSLTANGVAYVLQDNLSNSYQRK